MADNVVYWGGLQGGQGGLRHGHRPGAELRTMVGRGSDMLPLGPDRPVQQRKILADTRLARAAWALER